MPRGDDQIHVLGSNIKRMQGQATPKPEWEKIFATFITNTNVQIRKMDRDLNRLFT